MKRFLDIVTSLISLIILSPILIFFILLVWLSDFKNPFYLGTRVGKNFKKFKMVKLRSMIIDAEKKKVDSTSSNDLRITKIGKIIRKFKIDEIFQLINVLIGQMSVVGPRPNVERDVSIYTEVEKEILSITPGITDFSSIVFSDEGDILKDSKDPDLDYNKLIRPWKSRLALIYVKKSSFVIDIYLIFLTVVSLLNKKKSLILLSGILNKLTDNKELLNVVLRENKLAPYPPPGSSKVVDKR